MAAWLVERGVLPGAELLDAGCGTGRHAAELGRRGYVVHGIDLSPELIDVARQAIGGGPISVSFAIGDILRLPAHQFDAILCRGVLNDFVDDQDRKAVFIAFANALRHGGVLMLDVREWEASAERKAREPVFRKSVSTDRGTLTFSSVTELDPENRRLLLSERHSLVDDGQERSSDHQFVMRCWTPTELQTCLTSGGFGKSRTSVPTTARSKPDARIALWPWLKRSDADVAMMSSREFQTRLARLEDAAAIYEAHLDSIRSIGPAFYPLDVVEGWGAGLTPEIYVKAWRAGRRFSSRPVSSTVKPPCWDSPRIASMTRRMVYPSTSERGVAARNRTMLLRLAEEHALDSGATSIRSRPRSPASSSTKRMDSRKSVAERPA